MKLYKLCIEILKKIIDFLECEKILRKFAILMMILLLISTTLTSYAEYGLSNRNNFTYNIDKTEPNPSMNDKDKPSSNDKEKLSSDSKKKETSDGDMKSEASKKGEENKDNKINGESVENITEKDTNHTGIENIDIDNKKDKEASVSKKEEGAKSEQKKTDNPKHDANPTSNGGDVLKSTTSLLGGEIFDGTLYRKAEGFVDIILGTVTKKPISIPLRFGTSFFQVPGETAIPTNLGTNSISVNLTNPQDALHIENINEPYILWTFIKYVGSLSDTRNRGMSNDTFATFAGSGLGKPEILSLKYSTSYPQMQNEESVALANKTENTVNKDGIDIAYSVRNKMNLNNMKVGYYVYTIKTPIKEYRDNYVLDANSKLADYYTSSQQVNTNGNIVMGLGDTPVVSNGSIRGVFNRKKNNFRDDEDRLRPTDFISNDMVYHTGNYLQNGNGNKIRWFANAFNTHRESEIINYTIDTTLDSTQTQDVYKNYVLSIGSNGYELKPNGEENGSGNSTTKGLDPSDVLIVRKESTVKSDDTNQKMWHTFGGPSNREVYTPGGPNNEDGTPFETQDAFSNGLKTINPDYQYTRFAYIEPFVGRNKINKQWLNVSEKDKTDVEFKISSDRDSNVTIVELTKDKTTVWDSVEKRDRWFYDNSTSPMYNPWKRVSWNIEENSPTEPPTTNGDTTLMLKVTYTVGTSKKSQNVPIDISVGPSVGQPTLAVAYSKDASYEKRMDAILKKIFPNSTSGMVVKEMWVDNNGSKGAKIQQTPSVLGTHYMIIKAGSSSNTANDVEKRVGVMVTEKTTSTAWTVPTRYTPSQSLAERNNIIKQAIAFSNTDVNVLDVVLIPSYSLVSQAWSNKNMVYNFTNTKIREAEDVEDTESPDCLKYGVIKVGHPIFDPSSTDPIYPYEKEIPVDEHGHVIDGADPIYKVEPGIMINNYEYYKYPQDFKNNPNTITNRNRTEPGTFYQGGWLWGQFRIPAGAKNGDTFEMILPRELKANMQDIGSDDYVGPLSASIGGSVKNIGYISHKLVKIKVSGGEFEELRDKFIFHLNGNATWHKPYIGAFMLGDIFRDTDVLVNYPDAQNPLNSGIRDIGYALKKVNDIGPRTLKEDYKQFNITGGFIPGSGAFDAGSPYNYRYIYNAKDLVFESNYYGSVKQCQDAASKNPRSDITFNYMSEYINKQNGLLNKYVISDEEDYIVWRNVYNGAIINSANPSAVSNNKFYDVLVKGTQLYHGNNQSAEELKKNGDIKVYVTPYGNTTGIPESTNAFMSPNNTVYPVDPLATDWFKKNNSTKAEVWIDQNISRSFFRDRDGLNLDRTPQIDGHEIIPTSRIGVKITGNPPNTIFNNTVADDGKYGYCVVMDVKIKKDIKNSYQDNNNNNNKFVNTMYSDQSRSVLNQYLGEPFRIAIYRGSDGSGSASAITRSSFSFKKKLVSFSSSGGYRSAQDLDTSNSVVEFTLVDKNNPNNKYVSSSNGTGTLFFDGIDNGTYDLVETISNPGYAMNGSVEVKAMNGVVTLNGEIYDSNDNKLPPNSQYDSNSIPVIKNFEKPKLKVVKRDSKTGELLEDFKIRIQDALGAKKNEFGPGSSEIVPFADGMKSGMYILAEVQFPPGYGPENYVDPETGDVLEKNYVIKVGTDGKIYMRYDGLAADFTNSGAYNRTGIKFEPLQKDAQGNYVFTLNNVKQNIPPKVKYPTANFSIVKRNAKDMTETIQGAEFTIYTDKNTTIVARQKGVDNRASGPELRQRTGSDGTLRFDNILAYHMEGSNIVAGADYYMKETVVPQGYNEGASATVYHIHIDENGRVFIYEGIEGNNPENKKYETGVYKHMVVTNTKTLASVKIIKKGLSTSQRVVLSDPSLKTNNTNLPNVSFKIYTDENLTNPLQRRTQGSTNYEDYVVTTDSNGIATIDNLTPDNKTKYLYLKEIVPHNGYSVYDKSLRIVIEPTGKTWIEWQSPRLVDGKNSFEWSKILNYTDDESNFIGIIANAKSPKSKVFVMKRDWGQVMDFWRNTVPNNIWTANNNYESIYPDMFGVDRYVYGKEGTNSNEEGEEHFKSLSASFTLQKLNANGTYENISTDPNKSTKITRGEGHGNYPIQTGNNLGEISFEDLPDGEYKLIENSSSPGVPPGYEWQVHQLSNSAFDSASYSMVMYFKLEGGELLLSKKENEEKIKNNNNSGRAKEKMLPFLVGNEYNDSSHPAYSYLTGDDFLFGHKNYHLVVGNTRVFKLNMTKKNINEDTTITNPFEVKIYKYTGYTESEFANVAHSTSVEYHTDPKTKMVYAVVGAPGTINGGTMQNQSLSRAGYLPGLYYIEETRAPSGYIKPEGMIPFFILEDGRLGEIKPDGTIIDPKVKSDSEQFKVVGHLPNNQKNLQGNMFKFVSSSYDRGISQYVINFDFYNIPKPKFKIHKSGSDRVNLKGARFSLFYDEEALNPYQIKNEQGVVDNTLNTKTSGEDGNIIFDNLEIGKRSVDGDIIPKVYYLKETSPPPHYEQNNKVYKIEIDDKGKISFYDKVGTVWTKMNVENTDTSPLTMTNVGGEDLYTLNIKNIRKKVNLVLRKRDQGQVDDFYMTNPNKDALYGYSFDKNQYYYSNNKFKTLKASFNLYKVNGNSYSFISKKTTSGYGDNNVSPTAPVNDNTGSVTYENLADGEYMLLEYDIPTGYKRPNYPEERNGYNTDSYVAFVKYFNITNGMLTVVDTLKHPNSTVRYPNINMDFAKEVSLPMIPTTDYNIRDNEDSDDFNLIALNPPLFNINFTKVDPSGRPITITSGNSARVKVYASNQDGSVNTNRAISDELTLNPSASNSHLSGQGYAPGLYYLKETQVPDGYMAPNGLSDVYMPFYIQSDGRLAEIRLDSDSNGEVVATKPDGYIYTTTRPRRDGETGTSQYIEEAKVLAKIPKQNLLIGYLSSKNVTENNGIYTLNMSVKNIPNGSIRLKKLSYNNYTENVADNTKQYQPLEGAEFNVYRDDGSGNKSLLTTVTTERDGIAVIKDLKYHPDKIDQQSKMTLYYIKEVLAPIGYVVDNTVYRVGVKSNGETHINGVSAPDTIEVDPWIVIDWPSTDNTVMESVKLKISSEVTNDGVIDTLELVNKMKFDLVVRTRDLAQMISKRYTPIDTNDPNYNKQFYNPTDASSALTQSDQVTRVDNGSFKNNFSILHASYNLQKKEGTSFVDVTSGTGEYGVSIYPENKTSTYKENEGTLTFKNLDPGEYKLIQTTPPSGYLGWKHQYDKDNQPANVYHFRINENGSVSVLPPDEDTSTLEERLEKRADLIVLNPDVSSTIETKKPNEIDMVVLNTRSLDLVVRTRDLAQAISSGYYNPRDNSSTLTKSSQVNLLDGNMPNTTYPFNKLETSYSLKVKSGNSFVDIDKSVNITPTTNITNQGDEKTLTYRGLKPGTYKLTQENPPDNYRDFRSNIGRNVTKEYIFTIDINGKITPDPNTSPNRADIIALSADKNSAISNEIDIIALNDQKFYMKVIKHDEQGNEIRFINPGNLNSESDFALYKGAQFTIFGPPLSQYNWHAMFPVNGEAIATNLAKMRYDNAKSGNAVGLSSRTLYFLKEVKAPYGYDMLGGDIRGVDGNLLNWNSSNLKSNGLLVPFAIKSDGSLVIPAKISGNVPNNDVRLILDASGEPQMMSKNEMRSYRFNNNTFDLTQLYSGITKVQNRIDGMPGISVNVRNERLYHLKLRKLNENNIEITSDNRDEQARFLIKQGSDELAHINVNGSAMVTDNLGALKLRANTLYTLSETRSPSGYDKVDLGRDIEIPFAINSQGKLIIPAKLDNNRNPIVDDAFINKYTYITNNISSSESTTNTNSSAKIFQIDVKNMRHIVPDTGIRWSRHFSIILSSLILVMAVVMILLVGRRRNNS